MKISKGLDWFFASIQAHGEEGESVFPKPLGASQHLLRTKDSYLREWYKTIIQTMKTKKETIDDVIIDSSIEDQLFFGFSYRWQGSLITSLRLHALVTPRDTLLDFYHREDIRVFYFRLDYDPERLGPLFKESLPHIHICPDQEPRFSLAFSSPHTALADFTEWIYRNFFYDRWLLWAREISKKHGLPPATLDSIQKAYEAADIAFLKRPACKAFLHDLHHALHEEKRSFLNVSFDSELSHLSYL